MRMAQVGRVAVAGAVLGTLSTTSIVAVHLSAAPAPTPLPTFAPVAPAPPVLAAPVLAAPVLAAPVLESAPVDGATLAAAVLPARQATEAVRTTAVRTTPAATPPTRTATPVARHGSAPVVRHRPQLPPKLRTRIQQACAMDLLDDEMCTWGRAARPR
jgi:hypothetical protein